MRRTIGYVVLTFPLLSETFIENEIRVLRELGVDVDVVSMLRPEASVRPPTSVPGHRLTYRPSRSTRLRADLRWMVRRPRAMLANVWVALGQRSETMLRAALDAPWVADRFEGAGVEQVHAHFATDSAALAMCAARLLDRPYTFTAHALDLYVRTRGLCARAAAAAKVVTVCDYNVRVLLATCPNLGRDRIELVYCGVDGEAFVLRPWPAPHEGFRLVSVGRLVPKKGYGDLIEAVRLLRARGHAVTLDIIGEGRERPRLEEAIRRGDLVDIVRLVGSRPNSEVGEALAQADAFVLACVVDDDDGDRDSMPVVIKEAMAVGVPVIATDEVGIPEMVDDEVGRIAPPRNPEALADAIEALLRMPEADRRTMGVAGRARVLERFEVRAETSKLLRVFDEVRANAGVTAEP